MTDRWASDSSWDDGAIEPVNHKPVAGRGVTRGVRKLGGSPLHYGARHEWELQIVRSAIRRLKWRLQYAWAWLVDDGGNND